eukprot:UN04975
MMYLLVVKFSMTVWCAGSKIVSILNIW